MVGDPAGRRAEQRFVEGAAPAVPDDEQVGALRRPRAAPRTRRPGRARRVTSCPSPSTLAHLTGCERARAASRVASSISVLSVHAIGTRPESAGVVIGTKFQACTASTRAPRSFALLDGPAERRGRLLAPVDAHHDPPGHARHHPRSVAPPETRNRSSCGVRDGRFLGAEDSEPSAEHPCVEPRGASPTMRRSTLWSSRTASSPTSSTSCSPSSRSTTCSSASRDTVGELIPYDDITFYEADEAKRELQRRVRIGRRRREGARRRAVLLRRRDHGLGGRAPRARAREPRRARPARPLRRGHAARPRVADRRPARRARPPQGHAQHLPRRASRSSPRTSSCSPCASATPPRSRRQRAHPRVARAPGADRPADRPLEPPRVPRAAPPGARRGVGQPVLRRARDARPRRLQARQRRLQPRDRATTCSRRSPGSCSRSVRTSDCVCRIGGEEFAIIAPTSGLADAFRLAERVQEHDRVHGVRPGRAGEPLGRHRVRARARGEPPRARRLRRGRDDDREGAREGPDRRLPGGRPRAPVRRAPTRGAPSSARSRT